MKHFSTRLGKGLITAGAAVLCLTALLFCTSVFSGRVYAEKKELKVTNVFPADGSQDVFLTSGIEITFNTDTVTASGLKRSLEISPEIDFYVTEGEDPNTLVVYPEDEYEPETQYRVTIKAGLQSTNGRTLKEDVVFTFSTASENLMDYYQGTILAPAGQGSVMNALTTEIPAAFLLIDQDYVSGFSGGVPEASITLFRFDSDEGFLEALVQGLNDRDESYGEKDKNPARGIELHEEASFTVKAEEVTDSSYWWWRYKEYVLSFPEKLSEGHYLAQVDFNIRTKHQDFVLTKYLLVQSTELSAFVMSSGQESVAWLHNGATGEAVSDAKVSLYSKYIYGEAVTEENGTAKLVNSGSVREAAEEGKIDAVLADKLPYDYRILDADAGEHRFIEAISNSVLYNGSYGYGGMANEKYYTYLYTDRQIYSITDEIQFFGIVKPRSALTEVPETITVTLSEGWWSSGEITSIEVHPDEKGFFTGTLSFEDQQAVGYAYLTAEDEDGNSLMNSDSFSIEDYVKPTYTYEIGADKPVYLLGAEGDKEAVVSIDVHYFDKTPASGMGIEEEWASYELVSSGKPLTTDQDGHAEDRVKFAADRYANTWHPQTSYISYQSADVEDEILYLEQYVTVIPRDVMLLAENDTEQETLKVSTYAIDVSKVKERKDLYDTENLKGEGLSLSVTGKMYKCWYEKIPDGTRYDYIYKRSYDVYRYEYHEDLVEECVIETTNGEGSFSYHIEQDEENPACYYMALSVLDSAGMTVECRAGLSYRSMSRYLNYNSRETVYKLKYMTDKEEAPDDDPTYWGWYYDPDGKFSENEAARFMLVENDEVFELPEGAELLSATLLRGFSNIEAGPGSERSVEFSEDLVPNYYMIGAYFDGENTWPLAITRMVFDYETRNLNIRITEDQESYKPGETVTVTADILRAIDGTAVPEGTHVVLGVVDEAIFALREQNIELLSRLYSQFGINYSRYSSRNTATPSESSTNGEKEAYEEDAAEAEAPAEAGGRASNDEEYVRSEFKDSAYFAMAETNAEGKAVFSFTIPDNMTSWRLSVLAVTDDVWAGNAVKDIVCTSPYYTVPVLNDIMLSGESFSIGLRSAGTLADPGECTYEVSVRRAGEDTVIAEGSAVGKDLRAYTSVTLEGLEEGSYTVRIKGSCNEYTDVSEYPFTVVRSGLEAYASKSGPVSEMEEIHPLRYPVQLMIYDRDAYVYNAVLSSLLCSRDIRADERLGAYYAMTVLSEESGWFKDMLKDHDISDLRYIFPLFSYAKNDAEISALAYLAVPELLGSGVVRGITPSDIEESLDSPYMGSPYAAYLLQALAKEAFTEDISVLVEEETLSFRDRIYLMAALFVSGDTEAAEAAYDTYAAPFMESSEAVSGEVVYWLDIDKETTVQDDTAAALIMASLLHREEARGLALYLLEKPSDKNIYPLEEVIYLKNCEEKDAESCVVSYILDGESYTKELKRNRRIVLELQKQALNELDLRTVSGEPYVTVFYIAGLDELTDESTMKLTASVTLDKESYAVGEEAKITVTPGIGTLDPSIGCSTMVLDVYIPSGMRFERYTPDTSDWGHWYLVSREGQRLRFVVYDGSSNRRGDFAPVTFTASCVTPGSYIVEKAYLSSNHYDTWGISERGSVTITEE